MSRIKFANNIMDRLQEERIILELINEKLRLIFYEDETPFQFSLKTDYYTFKQELRHFESLGYKIVEWENIWKLEWLKRFGAYPKITIEYLGELVEKIYL